MLEHDDRAGRQHRDAAGERGARPVAALVEQRPLGAEREGLPESLIADFERATIPLAGPAESLNVAAAGAIALYELSRAS